MPKIADITVGIPFHNETKVEELALAIESIVGQTIMPAEIHLIQDGFVENSINLLLFDYLKKDSRFRHIMIDQRSGLSYALNLSILSASTNYYARMDSDDISHVERLSKQYDYLQDNPDIDIVGTWALEFVEDIDNKDNLVRYVPLGREQIYRMFHYRNPINHPTILFRKKVFAKIGLYNINFFKAQDTELYARAFKKKIGVANIPEVLYYLRNTDLISKRKKYIHIKYQLIGRYKYNTWSPILNMLKVASILFRFMPNRIQLWGYKRFSK